jgi:hypothetical protein
MSRNCVLSIVLVLGVTSGASAQLVDATLAPGHRFQGTISDAGDVDVVELPALDGESLKLSVKAGKGSGLRPRIELYAPGSDTPFASSDAKKKKAALKKTPLDETGTWEIHVSGLEESTGSYELRFSVVAGKTLKKPEVTPGAPVEFLARGGAQLSGRVRPAKGSAALPAVPQLDGPQGDVALAPFAKTAKSGKSVSVKKAVLNDFGSYTFTPLALDPGAADLLVKLKIRPPKPIKTIVVEGPDIVGPVPFAIAFDPSVASTPATDEADFVCFGIIVPLDDAVALPESMDWTVTAGETEVDSGTAEVAPDGTWVAYVPLTPGDNTVTVDAGDGATRSLDVTYNPGYAFGGSLQLTPDVVEGPLAETVTARILITDGATDPASVSLVRDGDPGQPPEFLTQLFDDGSHGDEQAADGIYTGTFVPEPDEGIHHYRVMLGTVFAVSATSEAATLRVMPLIDLVEIAARQEALGVMGDELDAARGAGTLDETLDTLLAQLDANPDVAAAGKGSSGNGLWILYGDGMPAIVHSPEAGTKAGAPRRAAAVAPAAAGAAGPAALPGAMAGAPLAPPAPLPSPAMAKAYNGIPRPRASWSRSPAEALDVDVSHSGTRPGGNTGTTAGLSSANSVGTDKALLLAPYIWQFGVDEELDDVAEPLANDAGFTVNYLSSVVEGGGLVSRFTNWSEYGVIGVSTHGDSYFGELILDEGSQELINHWGVTDGVVVLDTGEDEANLTPWIDDLFAGRVVASGDTMFVSPTFIASYAGTLPNSLVYLSSCRSTYNASMVSTLLELGAGAVLGYSEYVCASFSNTVGLDFFESLVESEQANVGSAYTPQTDPQGCGSAVGDAPAVFQGFGNQKLSLFPGAPVLTDPSFEGGPITSVFSSFDGESCGNWNPFTETWGPGGPALAPVLDEWTARVSGQEDLSQQWNISFVENYAGFEPTDGTAMAKIEIIDLPGVSSAPGVELQQCFGPYNAPSTFSFDWNVLWHCDLGLDPELYAQFRLDLWLYLHHFTGNGNIQTFDAPVRIYYENNDLDPQTLCATTAVTEVSPGVYSTGWRSHGVALPAGVEKVSIHMLHNSHGTVAPSFTAVVLLDNVRIR